MILDVDLPTVHDNGMFISAKVSRIVELIREHDHNLDVKWVPPQMRKPGDAAFAITERLRDGSEVVAFYVDTEEQFNEDVLARVYESDNKVHDVSSMVASKNAAAARISQAKIAEEQSQYIDLMGSMIRSHRHTYRHNGRKFRL